jgi:hypothetical protein
MKSEVFLFRMSSRPVAKPPLRVIYTRLGKHLSKLDAGPSGGDGEQNIRRAFTEEFKAEAGHCLGGMS